VAASAGNGASRPRRGRATAGVKGAAAPTAAEPAASQAAGEPREVEPVAGAGAAKVPAAERRAAAIALLTIWRDVARDLALVGLGESAGVRQLDLLDDLEAAAARLGPGFAAAQLRRLDVAGERLEGNVSPELVIDALALGWAG
jgi:hypothetical protein